MLERSALVLYGSETGTAQDGAEEVGRMLTRLHFAVQVLELNDVEPSAMIDYSLVVCTISTTGQGDIPVNARSFWKRILRAKLTATFLASLRFAVFGFGDSSYAKYNFAGLKLYKRLVQLGASPMATMGKGDEQHPEGHESTFLPWLIELKDKVLAAFPLPPDQAPIPEDVLLEPPWLLEIRNMSNGNTESVKSSQAAPVASLRPSVTPSTWDLEVTVQRNTRVTPEAHWQDVRHLEFSADKQVVYKPGDVVVIYPKNHEDQIQEIIDLMHWIEIADRPLFFSRNKKALSSCDDRPPSFQTSSTPAKTLRGLLTDHLDINSIPRRSFFNLIAHFTTDEFQKNRLLEFSNPEYLDELYDYTTRPRRSILEVLQEFDTVKIPWQWAATVFPVLRGRQFSIASGGDLMNGPNASTRFELLVAIVKYRTVIRKIRRGICSRYLEDLPSGSQISVTLQKGGLGMTDADLARPSILVGPGTGIAPIRSLVWHRLARSSHVQEQALGRCALFFGCRNRDADYFFQSEWKSLETKVPLDIYPAFSRDQEQKQYVQDLIAINSKAVFEILCNQHGMIFVCGSSGKMPVAVRQAIREAIVKESSMTDNEAESFLASMEKSNRYKQETW